MNTRLAIGLGFLACAGCVFDATVAGVPRITCQSQTDCPQSTLCRTSVGLCLPTSPPETVPPLVEERLVFPDIGAFGQRFSLGFRVTETLLEAPRVHVVASDGRELLPVTRDTDSTFPDLEYRYFYTAPADASAGVPEGLARVVVDLVDAWGNTSERLEVGSFTLDFTPPEVVAEAADLQLTPGTGNPLQVVSALTEGSTARISFVATEPLVGATLTPSVAGLQLVRTGGEVTGFVFTGFLLDAGQVEADVTLDLDATDRAGNPIRIRRLQLRPPLHVDNVPPAPPTTTVPRAVVYTRAPWGQVGGRGPWFEVWGDGGSVEPLSRVFVREPGSDSFVAQGSATDAGTFGPFSLGVADRDQVFVSTVDSAGNESTRVRVQDLSVLATLRGKVFGSTLENPNRLTQRRVFGPALDQPGEVEASLGQSVSGIPSWRARNVADAGPSFCANFATDLRRGKVVALPTFGTVALWEWDGQDWTAVNPIDPEGDGNPQVGGAAIGYDEQRERVVLTPNTNPPFTWEYDGRSWVRASTSYFGGANVTLVYLPSLGRLVSVDFYGTVYAWSGTDWQALPSGASGLAQVVTAASDRPAGRMLAVNSAGQTWAWKNGWTNLGLDAGLNYTFNSGHFRLVEDPGTGAVVLLEEAAANTLRSRTWLGADAGWSGPTDQSLPFLWGNCPGNAAWDPVRAQPLVQDALGRITWGRQADGSYKVLRRSLAPPPVVGGAAVWSKTLNAMVVAVPDAGVDRTDLWIYDGDRILNLGSPFFERRSLAAMAENPATGGLILHGGKLTDGGTSNGTALWTFDGGWQIPAVGVGPPVAAFAFAASRRHGGMVLHGGITGPDRSELNAGRDETWLLPFDGGAWALLESFTSEGTAFHKLSCDDVSGTCLRTPGCSFGGSTYKSWETPSTDGGLWRQSSTGANYGTAVSSYGAALDPNTGTVVMAGGRIGPFVVGGPAGSTGEGRSTGVLAFSTIDDPDGDGDPPVRYNPVMVQDLVRGVSVLWGGTNPFDGGAQSTDEFWEFHNSDLRPAQLFQVDLSRAGIRPESVPTGLSLVPTATGHAFLRDGGTLNAVELAVFLGGRWRSLGTVAPDGGAIGLNDASALGLLLQGQRRFTAAITPPGNNGVRPADVTLTNFEARLDYHQP